MNEVMNAMMYAGAMGLVLVLVNEEHRFTTCYDSFRMRNELWISAEARSSVFAFSTELKERHIACEHKIIRMGDGDNFKKPLGDIGHPLFFDDAHAFLKRRWKESRYENQSDCFLLPSLDGRSNWQQALAQCERNEICMARARSFRITADMETKVKSAYSNLTKMLSCQSCKYTCYHINPVYAELGLKTVKANIRNAFNNPMILENDQFASNEIEDAKRTQLYRNILVVSQDDEELAEFLRDHFSNTLNCGPEDCRIFTIGDLGFPLNDYSGWDAPHYT